MVSIKSCPTCLEVGIDVTAHNSKKREFLCKNGHGYYFERESNTINGVSAADGGTGLGKAATNKGN